MSNNRGLLVVISGPSGVGKGTLVSRLLETVPDARLSISVTTREPRPGEENGVDYHFVDRDRFEEMAESGGLLEWAEYAGNLYGTPAAPVDEAIVDGAVVLLEIEVQGALQIRERDQDALLVFVLPPTRAELARRLRGRRTEDDATVRLRLKVADEEMRQRDAFDEVVVNDDLDRCVQELTGLIERVRAGV